MVVVCVLCGVCGRGGVCVYYINPIHTQPFVDHPKISPVRVTDYHNISPVRVTDYHISLIQAMATKHVSLESGWLLLLESDASHGY